MLLTVDSVWVDDVILRLDLAQVAEQELVPDRDLVVRRPRVGLNISGTDFSYY
jgi:hypothetical protein